MTDTQGGPNKGLNLSFPLAQDTVLANGMRLETTFNGHHCNTTLVQLPDGIATDLQLGETVIG
ncbi:MAG: hypothetical protein AAF222_12560 [Pseudomonadota bacterium]